MKKMLPVAVLAAMAGVNGAQAVHVNPDGLGQVLLYPYFTTTEGQDTYIQIVNTTEDFKAVKVRILESLNSREVLDFNLYLSPNDHWSATITADPNGGQGAAIFTLDTTCTVPNRLSDGEVIPFRDFEYVADRRNGQPWGLERTREGYVEVIEMATIVNGSEDWEDFIEHVDGVPGDCSALDAAWADNGAWTNDPNDGAELPSGGLYGYGVLINVDEGTDATYDAVALDNFADDLLGILFHTDSGDLNPGLDESRAQYDVIEGNTVISGTATADGNVSAGLNAVSALITHDTISNDYVLEPSLNAGTDWVITFPTKRDYVAQVPAIAPFMVSWDPTTSTSCEEFGLEFWDREEGTPVAPPNPNDFSPLPPGPDPTRFTFCAEANVLSFNGSNVLSAPEVRNGTNFNLENGFDNGWARINFVDAATRPALDAGGNLFAGLPVIGFGVQKYVNGDVDGLLSNYVGNVTHKATRSVSGAP